MDIIIKSGDKRVEVVFSNSEDNLVSFTIEDILEAELYQKIELGDIDRLIYALQQMKNND